jgi:phosphopantothenoylcysteine decarboxylase / phosphopantothenate---cysteine ligase
MGVAIAEVLIDKGAEVHLVLGPVSIAVSAHERLHITSVESAQQMYDACMDIFPKMDLGIFAAAVADYTPLEVADQKIKKSDDTMILTLQKTKDILKAAGAIKKEHQRLIGFALETENEVAHAIKKIESKNLDAIIVNTLNDAGAGFKHDTNKIKIIDKNFKITTFELKSKKEVAKDIIEYVECIL